MKRTGFAGALVVLAAYAAPARAQQPPAVTPADDPARREFDDGVRLLHASRFGEAAAAFERSYGLRRSPRVLYDLGVAYRGMGAYRRAIETLDQFLATAEERDAQLVDAARNIVTELRAALAHATLVVTGSATDVRVDDRAIGHADGTYRVDLDPGRHVFEARRHGYEPARVMQPFVSGGDGRVVLDPTLRPIAAVLLIETENPRAMIRVDGRSVGGGRQRLMVTEGPHEIDVTAPGVAARHRTVQAAAGATTTLALSMRSPGLGEQWWFWTGVGIVLAGGAAGTIAAILDAQTVAIPNAWPDVEAIRVAH